MLLRVPPPERIDHAAEVAPPAKLAPVNAAATGEDDWHTAGEVPGVTVGGVFTVTVVELVAEQPCASVIVT